MVALVVRMALCCDGKMVPGQCLSCSWMFRYLVLLWLGFGAHALNAQDQIFLRNGDGVMECIILESNDSVIVFRTLDPTDLHEYEISVSAIYGFLLEDPSRGSMVAAPVNYLMEFQHTRKKRKPMFKEGNTILFRQWGDSSEMPRSARIIEIHQDSIQLELKTRRVPERLWFRWSAFQSFGYKTVFTESMTLLLAPVSALKDGSFFFYKKLLPEEGWKYVVKEGPQASRVPLIRKYPKSKRKVKLPKVVRLKERRK